MKKRMMTISLLLFVGLLAASDAYGYRVTGTFQYRDREQDETGFTGVEPLLPIRGADVQVLDNNSGVILGTGVTNTSGQIDVNVTDTLVRDIVVRVLTWTDYNPFLNIRVETWENYGAGDPYAVESDVFTAHNPGQDLDVGTVNAEPQGPGEPFNIFDCLAYQMAMINVMTGDNPAGFPLLRARFTHGENPGQAFYNGIIHLGAEFPWDDSVILHEGGHYTNEQWSWDDNPGGTHFVGDVNQDPRLSYAEAMAHYFQMITARLYGLVPDPHLQVHTTGAPGTGNLDFYIDFEQPNWGSYGPACEVAVAAALLDLHDDASWPDFTPGEGEVFDELNLSFDHVWYLATNFLTDPTRRPLVSEDFWDAWMEAFGDTAYYDEMATLFDSHVMEYWEDDFEPDDNRNEANPVALGDDPAHHTLYPVDDLDWFTVQGIPGARFEVSALNKQPVTYSLMTVYEPDGLTLLADNSADVSQQVQFVTDEPDPYYIRINQQSGTGIYNEYGAYDIGLRLVQAPDDSAEIQVTPAGIVVLDLVVGGTTEREFTINNIGGGPLVVSVSDVERYVTGNPPAGWISESPETGTVDAGSSMDVTVLIDGSTMHPDTTYDAIIRIDSNDMINPRKEIIVRVMTIPLGIEDVGPAGALPKVFALNQNYPNPFNPSTSIVYDVPESVSEAVDVRLSIYNTRGQLVRTLVDESKKAGRYSVHWDGTNASGEKVGSGIYFYKILAGDYVRVKKMVLLK